MKQIGSSEKGNFTDQKLRHSSLSMIEATEKLDQEIASGNAMIIATVKTKLLSDLLQKNNILDSDENVRQLVSTIREKMKNPKA